MRTRKKSVAIIGMLSLVVIAAGGAYFMSCKQKQKNVFSSLDGSAPSPVCLLAGGMNDTRSAAPEPGGFENLSGMIRLNFKTETIEDCKEAVISYCRKRQGEGYTPGNLTMTFREDPSTDSSQRFEVKRHCSLESK